MEWTQVFTFIGVNVALFGVMATLIIWAINKMDTDIKAIGNRLDNDIKSIASRLDGHASRIDQLYRMFIDLLKEKK